jgi:acetyltransferase-like isoleucine patch superfamily enzyme
MKNIAKLITVLMLLTILLAPAAPASARGLGRDLSAGRVIFGDDFVLKTGETLDGDLVVFGGNITLESSSSVNGSVAVIGGNVEGASGVSVNGDLVMIGGNMDMNGTVNGNMVLLGGNASLGKSAIVNGDVTTMGGNLDRGAGSLVTGDIVDNPTVPSITIPDRPQLPNTPTIPQPNFNVNSNPLGGLGGAVGRAILAALIAVVASLFLQPQMDRVRDAITNQPLLAGSFGLLAVVVSAMAILIMALTLILIPVSGLGLAAVLLAWLFGIVALGQEVGDRLARRINQTWTVPLSAGIGTLLLMLVVGVIGLIPCVGWVVPFVVGLAGLGGVTLTYFGSRRYPQTTLATVEMPPAS